MAQYRYLLADLLSQSVIGELAMLDVSYELTVNAPGPWGGRVPLDSVPAALRDELVAFTRPGRGVVYVERDGVLMYPGIIWGRKYDKATRTLVLDGADLGSYWSRIHVTDNLTYTQIEQNAISRSLLNYGQSKAQANIGVEAYDPNLSTATPRDRSYLGYEAKSVLEAQQELAAVVGGSDFRYTCQYDGSTIRRLFVQGAPKLGLPYSTTHLVFDWDSETLSVGVDEDATQASNTTYVIGGVPPGAPANSDPPVVQAFSTEAFAGGWARLERIETANDVTVITTLSERAQGIIATYAFPVVSGPLKRRALGAPMLGTYLPGSEVRSRVSNDPRWPDGLDVLARIQGVKVNVAQSGDDTVDITLSYPGGVG